MGPLPPVGRGRRCRRGLEVGLFDATLESLAEKVERAPSADRIAALLADKGSDAVREELTKAGIEAVIPARRNRKGPAA